MEENNNKSEGNDGMAEKERLDLDAMNNDLMKDVREAGKFVKQRKQREKAAEAKAKDKTLMYTIVVFATLVLFAIAYWKVFMAGTPPQPQSTQGRVHSMPAPVQQQPQQQQQPVRTYAPAPQTNTTRPTMPTYHPPRVVTPSQPAQPAGQVPSENTDEGQDGGM
jgi:cytoskeletal protein RodZ